MREFDEIIQQKGLPGVGQTVRSKDYGTLWRVISKAEEWQTISDDPESGEPRMVPAVQLTYWRVREGVPAGVGKTLSRSYTLLDNTFAIHWEIVS